MYKYFLLAVNTFSRMTKIKGFYEVSASEVINALKFIHVQLYNLKFYTELHIANRI